QDVLRLNVTVNYSFIVGVLQGVAHLRDDLQRQPWVERAGLEKLPQVGAVHEFHEEIEVFAGLAEIMHPDDMRMAESGQSAGFTGESLRKRRVAAPLRRQDFDGHEAVELELPGFVDGAHTAL